MFGRSKSVEVLSARRAGMLFVVSIIYLSQQLGNIGRSLDNPRLIAWGLLSVVILGVLLTNGNWLLPKATRDILDDELTRSYRAVAIRVALTAAMVTGFALYAFAPSLSWGVREAAHAMTSIGLGSGLVALAYMEWRSNRDG